VLIGRPQRFSRSGKALAFAPQLGTMRIVPGCEAVPDTVRFLLILACLIGAAYGGVWALANFPPEQTEIVRSLPHEKIRQQ
jgi:hypothetical protein